MLLCLAFIVFTRSVVQKGDIHAGFEQMGEAGGAMPTSENSNF